MLFGKPLLKMFNAIHDYTEDTICILKENKTEWVALPNQFASVQGVTAKLLANLTVDIKQLITTMVPQSPTPISAQTSKEAAVKTWHVSKAKEGKDNDTMHKPHGGLATPLKGSPIIQHCNDSEAIVTNIPVSPQNNTHLSKNSPEEKWSSIWLLDEAAGNSPANLRTEQPDITQTFEPTLLTRKNNPHNPARVKAILTEITIGEDLSSEQTNRVKGLLLEYAECFSLSMSKVTVVEGAAHHLDIPRDKQFKTKVNQRPESPLQKEFFYGVLNKMLTAGII